MSKHRHKNRGSLTVEACIAFPVFLCFFFVLLFCVRFACISLTLDHAVNETAKQIAAAAYPVKYLNALEEGIIEQYGVGQIPSIMEEAGKLPEYAGIGQPEGALADLLTGSMQQHDIKTLINKVAADYLGGVVGSLASRSTDEYWAYKSDVKYRIAKALMEDFAGSSLMDPQRIRFTLVEFPQSEQAYTMRREQYRRFGFEEGDISQDDVVVQVEYRFDMPLPFFGNRDITMVHTAVEKAWLKGSCEAAAAREEGLSLFEEDHSPTVYVTRTGIRYHVGSCRYLYASKIPMPLSQAELGYTPCKVCKPPRQQD